MSRTPPVVNRRYFLRAAGITLALPLLESLSTRVLGAGLGVGSKASVMPAAQDDFTLFSGLDHGVKGGHFAIHSFLSDVRSVDAKGMPEGNISLDQRAAEIRRLDRVRVLKHQSSAPNSRFPVILELAIVYSLGPAGW